MKSRFLSIVRKEVIHIIRDPRTLTIIFLLPVIQMILFGYAITFDIKNIKLGILDHDQTAASRELIHVFSVSPYFSIQSDLKDASEIETLLMMQKVTAVLVIPCGFSRSMKSEPITTVQAIIDGSNANNATIVKGYIEGAVAYHSLVLNARILKPPVEFEPRIWYNPDLKSTHFIVPGLLAILLMMICALLTSLTIAREKETGTMEQILVSPIRPYEIIFGKVLPYILIGLVVATTVLTVGKLVFNVPFRGRILYLFLFATFYIYASLSIGVFVSSRVKSQQIALMASLLGTLLPSILLSGFIFPISSLPKFLQWISCVIPATYFLKIIRSTMLKGMGFDYSLEPTLYLILFGTVILLVSVKNFKTKLEE
jgi:ABC-2 type transport system permease protein